MLRIASTLLHRPMPDRILAEITCILDAVGTDGVLRIGAAQPSPRGNIFVLPPPGLGPGTEAERSFVRMSRYIGRTVNRMRRERRLKCDDLGIELTHAGMFIWHPAGGTFEVAESITAQGRLAALAGFEARRIQEQEQR